MAQIIKGTDVNGYPVQMSVDLSKDLIVENIPSELDWELKTIDEFNISETTEWVGAAKKH